MHSAIQQFATRPARGEWSSLRSARTDETIFLALRTFHLTGGESSRGWARGEGIVAVKAECHAVLEADQNSGGQGAFQKQRGGPIAASLFQHSPKPASFIQRFSAMKALIASSEAIAINAQSEVVGTCSTSMSTRPGSPMSVATGLV